MRLWSLHPQYLDAKGLVALWREALLAQAVLAGKTRGYRHHPQLARFRSSPAPRRYIAAYLCEVHAEAARRGYRFDSRKIGRAGKLKPLPVSRGQLAYEARHLRRKLFKRDRSRLRALPRTPALRPHPLLRLTAGGIADWEISVKPASGKPPHVGAPRKARKKAAAGLKIAALQFA